MSDLRTVIGVTLDLHETEVTRELVECRCGWLTKRGLGAKAAKRRHLEDALVSALIGDA